MYDWYLVAEFSSRSMSEHKQCLQPVFGMKHGNKRLVRESRNMVERTFPLSIFILFLFPYRTMSFKKQMLPSDGFPTRLTIRAATSNTAVFVGAQASVFRPLTSMAHKIVLMVLVLPVPGGPHNSFKEEEWLSIAKTQSATAFSCDSFRLNFSRPRPHYGGFEITGKMMS